jgi:uncharacterized LabA/DUF88 family protein
MLQRVVLFVDLDNLYFKARDAFPQCKDSSLPDHVFGQFDPVALGHLICDRAPAGTVWDLHQVRVYTGMPSRTKESQAHRARQSQCNAWTKRGAVVLYRSLQYLSDWPKSKPRQKGVDVALALDYVMFAVEKYYDVGVLASMDTDMLPALKYVHERCGDHCTAQVAAWRSPTFRGRLSLPGRGVWCHQIEEIEFRRVMDLRDYLAPIPSS